MITPAIARRVRLLGIPAAAAMGFACFTGCQSNAEYQASRFRSNPTPELDTTSQRRTDMDNKLTIVNDTNLRSFNEDMGRLWLMEKPSTLTPQPTGW